MPNSRQAKKRMRQDEKKRLNNRATSSAMKTALRRVSEAMTEGDAAKVDEAVSLAYKRIDKAAKANIIHNNTAARRKSLIARTAGAKSAS
ncbi:MAG: small subunit ribosomal protein S20 [Pseudohongiellaceae bacterium]|jgi:small subunit ribosomal protein S20